MRLVAMIGFAVLYGLAILPSSLNPSAKEAEQDRAAVHVRIPPNEVRVEDVSSIDRIIRAYYQVVSSPAGQPRGWASLAPVSRLQDLMVPDAASQRTDALRK